MAEKFADLVRTLEQHRQHIEDRMLADHSSSDEDQTRSTDDDYVNENSPSEED